MSKSIHRINDSGTAVVCAAPEDADCRKRSHCDSEGWHFDTGCTEHDGKHPALPGSECWMSEHLNAIDLRETNADWEDPPAIIPGAPIEIEFLGTDEGCSWAYTEATPVTGPDVTRPLKTSYQATFEITPLGQNLLFGGPIKPPTHQLIIEHVIPRLPEAPRKGHPLVGKRYRMARRKHGQAIRRWARDGYAMDTIRTYMPAVNITFENETR